MRLRTVVLFAAGLLCVRGAAWAQSFTILPSDTVLSAPLGSEMVFNCTITNTSPSALTLFVVRTLNDLPQGWESSLCFDVCYPPTVDSIVSPQLNPGDTLAFSLHVFSATNSGTGVVRIVARNTHSGSDQRTLTFHPSYTVVGVTETPQSPGGFSLDQNFPNPFNPSTTISFSTQHSVLVNLNVYSVLGQEVARLVNEVKGAGTHVVTWDGSSVGSGIYFCRMQAGAFVGTRKLLLVR